MSFSDRGRRRLVASSGRSAKRRKSVWCLIGLWIAASAPMATANEAASIDAERITAESIEGLVQSLGDDRYVVRQDAAERLRLIGLPAFDRLYDAQYDSNLQVSIAARRLLGAIAIDWSEVDDSRNIRELLAGYSGLTVPERRDRIELLAGLPDREGALALARIARYETSPRLSAAAAIAIIVQPPGNEVARLSREADIDGGPIDSKLADQLLHIAGDGNRVTNHWITAYAEDLKTGDFDDQQWNGFVEQLRDVVDASASDRSDRQSALQFVQSVAIHGRHMGHTDSATALMIRHLDLIEPKTAPLIEIATWSIRQGFHPVVERLSRQFQPFFQRNAILAYSAAESAIIAGDQATGDRWAAAAFDLPPLPDDETAESMQPAELALVLRKHDSTAQLLARRGLYRWAVREYAAIIDVADIDSPVAIGSRLRACRLYSEMDRHRDVVDCLKPIVERIEKDRDIRTRSPVMQFNSTMLSTYQYHRGELLLADGNRHEAVELMLRAYMTDQQNVDILIRLYHLSTDPEMHQRIVELVRQRVRQFEVEIAGLAARGQMQMFPGVMGPAGAYNNYAWLVANTEGDYALALQYANRSLEATDSSDPEQIAERMDTVARCHYALGQIDQAIAVQRRAVDRLPNSLPILNQLKFFQQQRRKASGEDNAEVNQADRLNDAPTDAVADES